MNGGWCWSRCTRWELRFRLRSAIRPDLESKGSSSNPLNDSLADISTAKKGLGERKGSASHPGQHSGDGGAHVLPQHPVRSITYSGDTKVCHDLLMCPLGLHS